MKIAGIDIGSTTVKGVVVEDGQVIWRDYGRHNTRQAEKARDLLARMEAEAGLTPGRDTVCFTGSGAGMVADALKARAIQEVVAVAAAVEALHPDVHFVSEIGGEDMKTIFITRTAGGTAKQVYMQSACSGGTGTFIEKSARKLNIPPESLTGMTHAGRSLHRISAKCGIFAETDANSLVKAGVPAEEIIASLFDAVVMQNLATLTKGNTPLPKVLLLGGPNMFFKGLQEAWVAHLGALWADRGIALPPGSTPADLILVPPDALYYACLGCTLIAAEDKATMTPYAGLQGLDWWIAEGQSVVKASDSRKALVTSDAELAEFKAKYTRIAPDLPASVAGLGPLVLGLDFGSATVKAVAMTMEGTVCATAYFPSQGNPIEDAKAIFARLRAKGVGQVAGLGLTGYGKDLLKSILGADAPVVETVAHATGALHVVPDADVICDVGGCDVKILLLRQGAVVDFRLNSQCSSGNGAFLQGVAERYAIPLADYADHAFAARAMPGLMMGCGVFLQSDIVNQQRKGWTADEIMAALASVLPLNVWVYAGQFQNLRALGRKFVLQGGTHLNLAVVKAQVDFIRSRVPGAEVVVHPFPGEAGAMGAAILALKSARQGKPSAFVGFDRIAALDYRTTASDATTCHWCEMNCRRAFIDVKVPGAVGRPDASVPLAAGWERIITGNSCAKGLIEDAGELRLRKAEIERTKDEFPNAADLVRDAAFR